MDVLQRRPTVFMFIFRKSWFGKPCASAVLFLLIALFAVPISAQTPPQTPALTIKPADVALRHAFGARVEAAGSLLLVSAPGDISSGLGTGALHVFERDASAFAWTRVMKIVPQQQGETIGAFATDGVSFAYVLQAPGTGTGPSIQVWRKSLRGIWEAASLETVDGVELYALAVDGDDLVAVSIASGSPSLMQSVRVDGVWQGLVTGAPLVNVPTALDLHGDVLVAGSAFSRRSGPQGLFPEPVDIPPPGRLFVFGDAVGLSDDGRRLAMGVSTDGVDGPGSGSVYLYDIESGDPSLTARLASPDIAAYAGFGAAVRFDGNRLAVSAPGREDLGVLPRTYVFEAQAGGGFAETLRLDAGGTSLGLAGESAFVGVPTSAESGAVLVYALDQVVTPPQVMLDPITECPASSQVTVSGSVSGSEPIAGLSASVNGSVQPILCFNCGVEPSFSFPASLLTCHDNVIVVQAQDSLGQIASATTSVYFDDADPVIAGCQDQSFTLSAGESHVEAEAPQASDGCELVSFECTNDTSFGWPRFPVGFNQPATCVAVDRCGRQSRCDFTVTVESAPTGTLSELLLDFETQIDGSPPSELEAEIVGGGSGTAEVLAGLLRMTHTAPPDEIGDKGEMRLTARPTTMSLLLAAEMPEADPGSGEGLGGLIVSVELGEETFEAKIVREEPANLIRFLVRPDGETEFQELAPSLAVQGQESFQINLDSEAARLELILSRKVGGQEDTVKEVVVTFPSTIPPTLIHAGLTVSAKEPPISNLLAGPLTKSAESTAPAIFTFATLEIREAEPGEPTPTACETDDFNDDSVDPAWTLTGIGNASVYQAVETGGELQLTATGATAFYGADNAGFLYREVSGDFRVETTLDGAPMTTGGKFRKAGLMVRQSLDTWDVRLLAFLVPYWQDGDETHLQFAARKAYGAPGYHAVAKDVVGVPRDLRLAVIREGQTLSVEYSLDHGFSWIRPLSGLGGSITLDGLAPTLLVGLGMVSNDVSVPSTAHFDDVSLCRP